MSELCLMNFLHHLRIFVNISKTFQNYECLLALMQVQLCSIDLVTVR